MANPLVRDPKGQKGNPNLIHNLPKQESMAFRANLAVAQDGLTPEEQALVAQEATVGKDSQPVQNYLVDMSVGLHEWSGNAAELAKFIPAIRDMNSLAQADVLLKKDEKKRVDGYAKFLIQFIQKKTTLKARIQGTFKNVVKTTRTNVSESLSDTNSIIGKIAGAMLKPRKKKDTADLDIKKARAASLDKMEHLEARSRRGLGSSFDSGWDNDDDGYGGGRNRGRDDDDETGKKRPRRVPTPAPEPTPEPTAPRRVGTFKTIPETGDKKTSLTGTNVRLDKVVVQVTKTNDLLRGGLEADKQREDARERAEDSGGKAASPLSLSPIKEKKDKDGSLLGGMGKMLGLGRLGTMLLPAVGALAKGLAVAGAFAAGWKLGEGLDKLSGGRLSGGVQYLADWLFNSGNRKTSGEGSASELQRHDRQRAAALSTRKDRSYTSAAKFVEQGQDLLAGIHGNAPDALPAALVAPSVTSVAPPAAPVAPPAAPRPRATPQSTSPVKVPVGQMHVSEEGIAKLKKREGVRREPYWDVNGWAIGFGDHEYNGAPLGTNHAKKPNVKLSKTEADDAIRRRLQTHYEPIVRKNLGAKSVSQNEFDALVSVAYNSEAAGARLARRTSSGEILKKEDFLASGTVHGVRVAELQTRRAAEYAQFVSVPSAGRAAAPMAALSARAESNKGITVVNAPVTQIAQGGGSTGMNPLVIQPISVNNPDPMVRAIRSVNAS